MIRFFTVILFLAGLNQAMLAQVLIPFLAQNGKYGFVNERGKMVIKPEFDGRIEPFLEKTLAIDCQKNGESVRLFRNGFVVPNPRLTLHRTMPVLDYDENGERLDSIAHLLAFQVEQTWKIIDLRAGGKTAETHMEDFLKLPKWAKINGPSLTNGAAFRFQHGLLRIFRADGRVNFLNKDLREILPKDVAAGGAADAQYLIFAESEGRFGVADRNGKTVVAPVFRSIEPSGKAGFFIANKQRNGSIGAKGYCGVVRANGNIVLDTIYSDIEKVDGADLFLVRNVGKTGLFDINGREIVPIEAEYGYKQGFGFSIFKWPNSGANLLDQHGKRLLEKNVAEVTPIKFAKKLFFKVKAGGWTSILDTSMVVLARDSVENLDIIEADPPIFLVRKNGRKSRLVDIRDATGRILVNEKFDHVWSVPGWPDGLRFTYLNDLKGIADKGFNEVLPPVFEEIVLEEGRRDTIIWAKKKGDPLFVAFDKKGMRRADIDNAPVPRRESAYGVIAKTQALPDGGHMATMFDGTQLRWPDSLKSQSVLAAFRSQTSGAIVVGLDARRITAPSPAGGDMRATPVRLATFAPLALLLACDGGESQYGGHNVYEYYPLDKERSWKYAMDDDSAGYILEVEKVASVDQQGVEVATLEYRKQDSDLLYSVDWSSSSASGVLIYGYTVQGGDT
ncbi:MAG: WG repeat-containing protein, partial [Saprospiraceae bacterium]|nr:WG repeat-containing protein [Saprospiraceae bacterium]